MVDWRITAKTIYCDSVSDEVTLLVYKDGTAKCTGAKKYASPKKNSGHQVKCDGATCRQLIEYNDKLFAEEARKNG